ncbi:MAG: hypothetical protein Q7V57_01725 [Actinomycetota bacterium]|nr:hypothetical protein [Actinomycetota bacterium]
MASSAYPLGGTERRLQQRVQALLGDGEDVRAAVVAILGPRPGLEAMFAPVLGLLPWLFANARRRFTTIAVTDRGLVILENSGLRRPVRVRERFDSLDVLGPMNDTVGDASIEVNGVRYWIEGIWSPQLYEMRKLTSSSADK